MEMKDASSLSLHELEKEIKSVKQQINELDVILYSSNIEAKLALMKKREANRYVNGLTDSRYELVEYRDRLESEYRQKRLDRVEDFNTGVLKFGAYTDVHTPKFKPSGKGHFSAIRGITL